jgi:hypothetical protein
MADRKSYAKKLANLVHLGDSFNGVKFKWATGGETSYDLAELPKEIILQLAVHGLSQKLGDLSSKAEVNSVGDMQMECMEVFEMLTDGSWENGRKRGPMSDAEKLASLEKQMARLRAKLGDAGEVPELK